MENERRNMTPERAETFISVTKKFGTPAYVYFQAGFISQLQRLANAIGYRPLSILYAVKALSNFRVLRTFVNQRLPKGVTFGVDAVSPGEVGLALKAGIDRWNILFTGNNTTDHEIHSVVKAGILPNIDSMERLGLFGEAYPGREVCIRVNPNVGAGHHDHCITGGPESKFGIWFSEAPAALKLAQKHGLTIVGVHQHIGSQILDPEKFITAMEVMFLVAPIFPDLRFVDFGGGLGVPYKPDEPSLDTTDLGARMTNRFAEFCREYKRHLTLIIEPGRFLVAQAGNLLVQVTCVKKNPDGRIFVGVDSGFNHLDRPARYGSYHNIINISNPNGPVVVADIVGDLCESGDKFAVQRPIAEPRRGDFLVIENAGAYGFSMSSNYNLRAKPPEIMVTPKGCLQEIRKRQSIDELIGGA